MFLRHIFMAGLATACGIAVSAGTFAFLLVIGVIPRMIKRCNFGERILMVENTVILGVLTGAVFSVVEWKAQLPYPWLAHVILGAYGTAAGIFVGCIAVALAEILNTFPILFRRLYINRGLSGVHGTGENGWFFLLFLFWLRASKILVNPYFLIAIFFVSGV